MHRPAQRPTEWPTLGPILVLALALAFVPLAATAQEPSDGKELPPPGGEPRDFELPATGRIELDNGLAGVLVPYGQVPKVTVSVRLRTGNIDEAADEVWLADLTGRMMQEGTASMDAGALARAVAGMGGELSITTTFDGTFVTADVLSEFAPDLVALLAGVVRTPALPESELARIKADMGRELDIALSQPQALANRAFLAELYPDHPYGRLYPTPEMLDGYTIEQVREHHGENFGARRTHLYVVGMFDEAAVEQATRDAFGDWAAGPEPTVKVPEMDSEREVHLIDRPGSVQSTLRLGLPVADPSTDDYVPLLVANSLLGGSFTSRITSNIREDKGYTYSPSSSVSAHRRAAHWVQSADVTSEVTGPAIEEIFGEIDRLQGEAPPQDELEGVKNYMSGVFVLQNSSRGGIIGRLWFLDLHGLPESYLTDYVGRVHAVTPEEVRRMASEQLDDERMALVVVGDAASIRDQVGGFGPIVD